MVRIPLRGGRGVVAAAMLVALVRTARADSSLDEARKDIADSDYIAARTALTAALASGSEGPDDLAEIYKLSGIVEGALGDPTAATAAFSRWIALDPKAALPPGTSPKIVRPFTAASDKDRKGELLKVKTETSATPPSVTLVIASDPLGFVASARVTFKPDGGAEQTLDGIGKGRITIALPKAKRLDLRVVALDAHGNRVVELGSADVPIVIVADGATQVTATHDLHDRREPPAPASPSQPRSLWASPVVWGAGTVVIAGVATYFGIAGRSAANDLDRLNASSETHKFSEAQALESTARRDLLVFNIGIGVAGAAAIGTAILYFTAPHRDTERRISAVPLHGGGTLVVGGRF